MTPEQATKLREPFRPEQIGKLPKPTKKDNPKGRCNECGGYHGLPAVHLDYVGHAAATDRLLQVDPEWSWEPMAIGPNGEPLVVNGGLWIKLTVAGVTKPGFGDEGNGKGMKEMIGDAIRNAAMRFGVALDLWAKEDLHGTAEDDPPAQANGHSDTPAPAKSQFTGPSEPVDNGGIRVHFGKNKDIALASMSKRQIQWYAETWEPDPARTSPEDLALKAAAVQLHGGVPAAAPAYDDSIPFERTI